MRAIALGCYILWAIPGESEGRAVIVYGPTQEISRRPYSTL